MKTTTISKRFVALLCCIAVCVALIATALGVNLASRAQAEDAQEDGIELLTEVPSGDIQLIEEEIPTPSEGVTGGEAYEAGETAVTEDAMTVEEPAYVEPDSTPLTEEATGSEDSTEPDSLTEPEGIPEEAGEPEDAEPSGSEEPAETEAEEPEESAEPGDAAEAEPGGIDAADEEADETDEAADAEDADAEAIDDDEEATSDEDNYGIMLLAADEGTYGNLSWELTDDGVLTISGDGAIPDGNTSSSPWYNDRASITSVIIEDGVTSIGNNAFRNCSNLESVEIPSSVTSIGEYAFRGCTSLKSVDIELPSTLTTIDNGAFYGCEALTSISIPYGVTTIGEDAFRSCTSLESVELPSTLTAIGKNAFRDCTKLISIEIPYGVTSVGEYAFRGCTSLESVDLPSTITTVDDGAFYNCSALTSITIPEGVTTIGKNAFRGCTSLLSIELPSTITTIDNNVFYGCSSLISVEAKGTITSIGEYAFRDCTSLQKVFDLSQVTSMGESAFYKCSSLTGTVDLSSLETIPYGAFYSCGSLSGVIFSDQLTTIGGRAFYECFLNNDLPYITTPVDAGAAVYSIDSGDTITTTNTTEYEGLTLTIPDSVTLIGEDAFRDSHVDVFIIGSNLTNITGGAFSSSTLTTIIFDNYQDQVTIDSYKSIAARTDSDVLLVYRSGESSIEITVTKAWDDADDLEGIRPDSITVQLLADGAECDDAVTLDDSNNWSYTWTDLPIYADGVEISYSVQEIDVPEDYAASYGDLTDNGDGTYSLVITNTHTPEQFDATVIKAWDDADDADGIRPDSITVHLWADNAYEVDSATITPDEDGIWSYTFEGLPVYRDGGIGIVYTITEDDVWGYVNNPLWLLSSGSASGYELMAIDSATDKSVTITNTHIPETTDITGTKTWNDSDDQDGIRPDSITVHLLADGVEIDSVTVTPDADGTWAYAFTGLPAYASGAEIVYSVTEDAVKGYETEIDGFDITNTHTPEGEIPAPTMSVDVGEDTEVAPGESLTYTIGYINGGEDGAIITITDVLDSGLDFVSATEGGTYDEATRTITWTITDVAAGAEGSVSFTVIVNESALSAGQISNSATVQISDEPAVVTNTVTNSVKAAPTVTFEVVKVWDDNNDLYGARPDLIVIVLLQNGQATTLTQMLSAENSWTGTFSDLPEYDADGNKIAYSIAEVSVPNYTSVITGDQDSGFTVTNTYDFDEITNPEPGTPDSGTPNSDNPEPGNPDSGNPEPVPQTGQDSLPIAPLAVSGAAIIAAGIALLVIRRRRAA